MEKTAPKAKTDPGDFFEDFRLGDVFRHATPRTLTEGDAALYTALYGSRFALQSSDEFARRCGLKRAPLDDFLVFHVVFGKTVPDISVNAIANLGYAEGRFLEPVYPGDTISTQSVVIGLKENSNRKSGVVYVRSIGHNQEGRPVLDYIRWVMVRKRDEAAEIKEQDVPKLETRVRPESLVVPAGADFSPVGYNFHAAGSIHGFEDYEVGERIDHSDGMTIEEAEHMLATRLYQNTARVHFNQHTEGKGRFGRRLIYGGHIISLARALSFNGLQNAGRIAAINGGRHVAPCFAGDTIYAWSEVLERAALPGREDLGALRLRTIATKNEAAGHFPAADASGAYPASVVLDLDYWVFMSRRGKHFFDASQEPGEGVTGALHSP